MDFEALQAEFDEYVRRELLRIATIEEVLVRRMLYRWVSELEPAVARRTSDNRLIGLTIADVAMGQICPIVIYVEDVK